MSKASKAILGGLGSPLYVIMWLVFTAPAWFVVFMIVKAVEWWLRK